MKRVKLKINGVPKEIVVREERVLLDVLRDDWGLKGTKQSCDRKGQCGACVVIVDGKARPSCLTKVADLDGSEVISIEGLGTPDNPHLIQEAFALAGAIQCGFCTPGMIMSAKALLDKNNNPSKDEIKSALKRNLCRCTGYKKIVEAIQLAGRFMRGELTPDDIRPSAENGVLGKSLVRPSAYLKACGMAEFAGDVSLNNAVELVVLRSPHNHALIKSIDFSAALKMDGVVGVMTAEDIKGTNRLKQIVADQPVLCDDKVHVIGSPIAALAAETKAQGLAALDAIKVEYEILPDYKTPAEAMAKGAIEIHPGTPNICNKQFQRKGDAQKALEEADVVVEQHVVTKCIHQSALEPESAVAWVEGDGEELKVFVKGRSINIHNHAMQMQEALGHENLCLEEAYTGGNFGIKMDLTTEPLAAAAALHFKRPVRYIASLEESMKMTTKRHPYDMNVRIGATKDGKITVLDMDYIVENGAYMSLGIGIMMRSQQMLSGSYDFENVRSYAMLVYTNNAWGGAARGAGPPQVNFAIESTIDMLAEKLGMDPFELRVKNLLHPGGTISTGQVQDTWEVHGCFDDIKDKWYAAKESAEEYNKSSDGKFKKGVGIAAASFGTGKGGPGDKATAFAELNEDGGVTIYGSMADPGEGTDCMITQVAGHIMGLTPDKVRLVTRSTDETPDCGAASGSRITFVPGGAVQDACEKLKAAMDEVGATKASELENAGKPIRYTGTKKLPTTPLDENGQGNPYTARVHGVQIAEVTVNTETGETVVDKMTCVVDPGTLINPQAIEGQIEGGLDMGVGMALREVYELGKTKDWVTFKFPTTKTMFEMETILRETPRVNGTVGACGVGEFVLLPTVPAVINAIAFATGVRITDLPATPEKIKEALAN